MTEILATIPWNTVPILAVVVAIAAAVGFGPLLLKSKSAVATEDIQIPYTVDEVKKLRRDIVEVLDSESIDDITIAHVIRLMRKGQFEIAKQAIDLAIAQRGAANV